MTKIIIRVTLPFTTTATVQTPIPRVGDNCPTQTYRVQIHQIRIRRRPKSRPSKTAKSGHVGNAETDETGFGGFVTMPLGTFCKRFSCSEKEALAREHGSKCPAGWHKSGSYCVKQRARQKAHAKFTKNS